MFSLGTPNNTRCASSDDVNDHDSHDKQYISRQKYCNRKTMYFPCACTTELC